MNLGFVCLLTIAVQPLPLVASVRHVLTSLFAECRLGCHVRLLDNVARSLYGMAKAANRQASVYACMTLQQRMAVLYMEHVL